MTVYLLLTLASSHYLYQFLQKRELGDLHRCTDFRLSAMYSHKDISESVANFTEGEV